MERVELRLDVSKMKIALLNIFLNAVEAMTNKSGILTISGYRNSNQYIIEISDNGIGMNDDQLNNIFEPFFSSKSKGFGIGLTASQTIIFNHGGNIDVRSELNQGTTFIINIPL
jgi:signal transduction histidine kinase